MLQNFIAFLFGTTIGIVSMVSVVSLAILIIGVTICDYFHGTRRLKVYVNTNGVYLPYVSTAISGVCKTYNAIVVATKVIKEPNYNPYLKHMQFTIICDTRHFKHIKEDLGQCILSQLNRLEYIIEEG